MGSKEQTSIYTELLFGMFIFFFYHGGHNGFLGAVALFRVGDLLDFVMQVDAMMPGQARMHDAHKQVMMRIHLMTCGLLLKTRNHFVGELVLLLY